jgi:hypothetical protein
MKAFGPSPYCLDLSVGGHRHRAHCRRYPTSDINICYSDIGDKCQAEKRNSDIRSVPISTSEFILISDIEERKKFLPADSNLHPLELYCKWAL